VDHAISSKLNLFGRYNYSPSNLDQRSPSLGGPVLSMNTSLESTVHTFTTGLTEIITPEISNEVRANYSNHRIGTKWSMDNFGGAVPPPDSLLFPPGNSSSNGFFNMYIIGIGEYVQGDQGVSEQRQINLIDNLSVTKGAHQFKFGADYRWLAPFSVPYSYRDYVQFSGMSAAPGGALSGTGQVAYIFTAIGDALLSYNYSFYGQDTWKLTPRLTLTYGLRWDVNPPLKGKNKDNDPFTVTGLPNFASVALAPRGTPLYQTTYGNVAPRVGVAYQLGRRPNWGATLRGGFGIFYDLGSGSLGGTTFYFPYIAYNFVNAPVLPLSPQDAAAAPINFSPPVSTILVADPHLKLPRSYQWNVALEQAIGGSQSVSLTYVGAIGRDLLRVTQLNNVNANFPNISYTSGDATSDYHAVQVKFQRRLERGLQGLASYSFSHSIDTSSTDAFASRLNTPGTVASPKIDRGDSDYDIRHAFSTGLTYDVPEPSAARGGSARAILGGWSVDAFVLARSAPPTDIVGALYSGAGVSLYPRPNVVPGVPLALFGPGYPGGKIFNKPAFSQPPNGEQGDLGRNDLRAFGASQADVGVQRVFRVTERAGVRFRAEFFNILNHPNFGSPTNSLPSALFGRSTQTLASFLGSGGANGGFNPLYQIGGPRSIQLALKLQF
jgi:hypothetical protein